MADNPSKLSQTFQDSPLAAHGDKWDALWVESFTPWDRGGPSLALHDVLDERPDLIPPPTSNGGKRALVPGCGRGHDVLLLAAHGYDVWGLDYSAASKREAIANQKATAGEAIYQPREGGERGDVKWVTGDFFGDEWLVEGGLGAEGSFDLIFDYTFLCALPPSARGAWAKRMAGLLAPEGRLVCLEWPSGKPLSMAGPPWGVTPDIYVALLTRPGEDISFDGSGVVQVPEPREDGLKQLGLIRPKRTHQTGLDEEGNVIDWVHVWSH